MNRIRFLTDNNVPDSVGRYLAERGHEVIRVRDILLPESEDVIIAAIGDQLEAIVVTWDYRDFRALTTQMPEGTRARFRKLGLLTLRCNAPTAARRVAAVIQYIEFEYAERQRLQDRRFMMDITDSTIRITTSVDAGED
ncbi:MAG: DUF5615 family PIN-like protein [Chloroflexota bacterium]|nr:DUF5615 family PIN-like protein [Chloroflexota bacterium]